MEASLSSFDSGNPKRRQVYKDQHCFYRKQSDAAAQPVPILAMILSCHPSPNWQRYFITTKRTIYSKLWGDIILTYPFFFPNPSLFFFIFITLSCFHSFAAEEWVKVEKAMRGFCVIRGCLVTPTQCHRSGRLRGGMGHSGDEGKLMGAWSILALSRAHCSAASLGNKNITSSGWTQTVPFQL